VTREERIALRATLANERKRSIFAQRERDLLKKTLSVALVAHMMFVAWAFMQPEVDPIAPRGDQGSDVMVQPTWIFPEEPKEELPQVKKEEPVMAAAPKVEPPKKVTPKKPVAKKKRVKKPKKKAVAIIASDNKDAPAVQSASVDQVADKAPEAPEVVADLEVEPEVQVDTEEPTAAVAENTIDLDGLRTAYIGKLNARFQEERTYPRAAKRAGIQGEVLLEVIIDANGRIKKAIVVKSSGHSILDAAAVEAITDVDDLPAPPSSLGWKDRSMRVPFVYRLS